MKYRSLESFRGLAAILVALYHSDFAVDVKYTLLVRSAIFVDFFFILSGFVIAFAYNDRIKNGFSFKQFFLLRLGRIYPLHLFLLLVWVPYIIAKAIVYHKYGVGVRDPLVANNIESFISNLLLINALGVHDFLSWNYPAWSISVEFYTYMIFFAVIALFKKFNDLALCLIVSIACYSVLYLNNQDTLLKAYDWGLIRCMGGFFLGSALYRITQKVTYKPSTLIATSAELAAVSLMIILVLNSQLVNYQLASFASFALVIFIFAIQEKGWLTKLLTIKPMLFLGSLSYSIYMTHALIYAIAVNLGKNLFKLPVKKIVTEHDSYKLFITPHAHLINLFILLLIIGLSYLTYRYIEIPWRDRFRRKQKRPEISLRPLQYKRT